MNASATPRVVSPRLDQVIDATRALFLRYGYRRTAMDDIAKEAGLAKATLYLHFSGKEEVFRAMVQRCREVIAQRCDEAEALEAPLIDRLARLLYANFGTALEWFGDASHMGELRAFVREEGDGIGGEIDFRARLRAFLAKAAKRRALEFKRTGVSLDAATDVLLMAAAGLKQGGGHTPETYAGALLDLSRLAMMGLASPSEQEARASDGAAIVRPKR